MNKPLTPNELKIMDPTGHTTVSWDPNNTDEVAVARQTFEQMTNRGYSAFRTADGKRGERISSFDPQARSLVLVPQLVGG